MNPDLKVAHNIPPLSYPRPEDYSERLAAYVAEADAIGSDWMPVIVTIGAVGQGSGVFIRRIDRPTKQTMRDAWAAILTIWPAASKIQCYPSESTVVRFRPKSDAYDVFVRGEWIYSHDRNGPCTDRVALADSTD